MNAPPEQTPARRLRNALPAKELLKIALALALMVFVLSRTDLQSLLILREVLDWQWLWVSLLLYGLVTLAKGVQYWALLGVRVPFRETLKIVIFQNAMTNFVTSAAGIVSYMTLFRVEQNVRLGRSGVVFLLVKAGDLLAMTFFLALSAWQVWVRVPVLQETIVVLLFIVSSVLLIFWGAVFMRGRFVLQFRKLVSRLGLDRFAVVQRALGMLDALAAQEQSLVVSALVRGAALSLLYMGLTMAYSYARFQIFHVPADFWVIIFITSIMQFVSIIPIQIFGGLGVSELTLVYLFSFFGVTQVDIPAIVVALRVLFYLFNLVVMLYLPVESFFSRDKILENKSVG